jgi:uncharacterized YigZ family protein
MKQLIKTETLEEVIKKSTFIAIVGICQSAQEAHAFIKQHSQADVTHNCWAFKTGEIYRFNDDGEPGGTAGMPILNAIKSQDFDNTVALVIRHYGGIKLGTGGLMRAYGGTVNRCLQQAESQPILQFSEIDLLIPFSLVQSIYNLTGKYKAKIISENYLATGVEIKIELLAHLAEKLSLDITNVTKGEAKFLNQ